ncbi:hypothetical protein COB64_03690 [Candidatus Wolfebacteria bacterium]|nr:MAG: hypothetical protein COB64_03690 [Candidatus Wolfebacteria bacterium]
MITRAIFAILSGLFIIGLGSFFLFLGYTHEFDLSVLVIYFVGLAFIVRGSILIWKSGRDAGWGYGADEELLKECKNCNIKVETIIEVKFDFYSRYLTTFELPDGEFRTYNLRERYELSEVYRVEVSHGKVYLKKLELT